MIDRDTFRRLAVAIKDFGEVEEKTTAEGQFRVCSISELSLILMKMPGGWAPEGITFELFGNEFFLTGDGEISLPSADDDDLIYSMNGSTLLSAVSSFLKWRLAVLERQKL